MNSCYKLVNKINTNFPYKILLQYLHKAKYYRFNIIVIILDSKSINSKLARELLSLSNYNSNKIYLLN